jgi:phage baseplate assembly protein W
MADSIFSDFNLAFTPHPVTGAISRKLDREAVKQSVKSLVLTDFYERPFKPNIGCGIRGYLFELWTPAVKQQMENAIKEVIANYEPRAILLRVVVNDNPDYNRLTVTITFRTKNDPTPIVLDVILERVR